MTEAAKPPHVPDWVAVKFIDASVSTDPVSGRRMLFVSGETPSDGPNSLGFRIVADKMYLVEPDYWEISLQWDRAETLFQSVTPYHRSFDLAGRVGTKGIELVGKDMSKKIDVP